MIADQERAAFEALAQSGADKADATRDLVARLKTRAAPEQLKALAALWLHVAAASPEDLPATFDAAAEGWLAEPIGAGPIRTTAGHAPALIPRAFWTAFWSLAEEDIPLGPAAATGRAAVLGGLTAPEIMPRIAKACGAYPGLAKALSQGYPRPFSAAALARCKPGSLGAALRDLQPNLDVLPRPDTPAPLDILKDRIVQARNLWRLAAGYEATALHEMALGAFELGQTGHPHAATHLALVLLRLAVEQPAGGSIVLQTILTAWAHGRRTPSLLGVPWEAHWDNPLEAVRAKLRITPYASPFPANIFEQAAA